MKKVFSNGNFLRDQLATRHHAELDKILVPTTLKDGSRVRYLSTAKIEIPQLNIVLKVETQPEIDNKIFVYWTDDNKQPFSLLAALL